MKTVPFTNEHKALADVWCIQHGMAKFPEGWLPPTGIVVQDGDSPVLMAWLYITDSGVAFLENVISSLDTTKEQRKGALIALADEANDIAKACGCKYVVGLTSIRSLADTAKEWGFIVSEPKYMTLAAKVK